MKLTKKLISIALTAIITATTITTATMQASAAETENIQSQAIVLTEESENPTEIPTEISSEASTEESEFVTASKLSKERKSSGAIQAATEAPTEISKATIKVSKTSLAMGVNESAVIKASIYNTNGVLHSVKWTSSDNSVLKVNNGKLTALKNGTVAVTAALKNGNIAKCYVTVKNAPTSVSLNKTSITLGVGEQFKLSSTLPAGCASYSVKYTTNKRSVADVNASEGIITAKSAGTAVITATTYNGNTVTCTVTVKNAPTSLTLNKTSLTLGVGETYDLNSKIPAGTAAYSILYSSSNSNVATAKASGGLVTAKAVGTAVVTAKAYNGLTVTCVITVKNAPATLMLNKSSLSLPTGKSFDLNSSLNANTASHTIKYTSSNSKVATVKSAGGLVTPVAEGTATITATTYNGKTAKCTVKVTKGYSEDDLFCLAAVIWQEAGSTYCSDNLQLMVGNVVLNRVKSNQFPDTIRGVITSKYAYGMMYWNGVSIPNATDPITKSAIERCYANAEKLLDGYRILPDNVVFQAGFVQGSGVHAVESGQYFCYM
ncbi:MAG: Ig-like domain-containing protein [Acutalibacteraceae bacterium]|nr:Ig-like domain-containing protein [Acutalibacteraceae bacterium]